MRFLRIPVSRSAGSRVAFGFGLALLLLISAGFVANGNLSRAADIARSVDHTRELIERLNTFLFWLRDAEDGQHGLLRTGDPSYLATSREALTAIQRTEGEIRTLTADNPFQQRRLDRLSPVVQKLKDLEPAIEGAGSRRLLPGDTAVLDEQSKQLALTIRQMSREMREDAYRLLRIGTDQVRTRARLTRIILLVTIGAAIGLLLFAILGLYYETERGVRTRRALEESELNHQLAVEASGIGTWAWEFGKNQLFYSDICKERFGLSHDTVVTGEVAAEAVHPADLALTQAAFHRAVESGDVFDFSYRSIWPDGTVHWVRTKGSPERDSGGHVVRFRGVVIDIDEQKRAEQALQKSERRYSALFANKINAIAHCRPTYDESGTATDYVIIQVNEAYESITGIKKADIEGKTCREAFPDIDRFAFDFIETFGRIAQNGGEISFEAYFEPLKQWLSIYAYSPEQGEVIAIFTDVTNRHEAQEQVRRLNAELESRVAERTAELQEANQELEAFSYSVSHDLRAPLRGIDGFARILLEEFAPQFDAKPLRYLQLVRSSAKQMGNLVDDLLRFSRLKRQDLKRQPVNALRMVEEVWNELQMDRENRRVELVVQQLPNCAGEPAMLKQVWFNLMSNAVKFTRLREPAQIEVGCLSSFRGATGTVYFVRDNGVGFDMRYASEMFTVFRRLHRAEDYEGTGVGLAIVQRIVRRHGGDVTAEAEPDRGATFYFTLEGSLQAASRNGAYSG